MLRQILTVFNGLKLLQTGFDRFQRVQTCSDMFSIVVFRHERRRTLRLPSLVPDDDERLEFSAVDVVEVAKVVVNVVRARHLTTVTSNKLERKKKYNYSLQWASLNVITVNVIELNQYYQSQITLLYLKCASSSFGRCYHSMNVISYGLAQSDHIKLRLLQLSVTNIKVI
jgi:hypothetical protein